MKVTPVKTKKITPKDADILEILDRYLLRLKDKSVVAVTSKIVGITEGNVVKIREGDKDKIIIQEAEYYLPRSSSKYNVMLTIKGNAMNFSSGVDESNSGGYYVLWPKDPLSFSTSCSFQKPLERELLFLPEHCQDFILQKINFSSCVVPQYPEDPNILQEGAAECASYLEENFTYHACFQQYQNEPNFTKNEWHLYMNTDFINPRYDLLKLYDAQGLLVDTKELQ